MKQAYDYVVVGAGSAGCVITRRLIDAGKHVLLLEAGPKDDTIFIKMPGSFIRVLGTKRSWLYQTQEQAYANQRSMFVPQGRTLGGGSSINAMVYIRGTRTDYDEWAQSGCTGWSWNEVLPYFKKSENNQIYANEFHGNEGLLNVDFARFRHPLSSAFVRAAQQVGLPHNADFNGEAQAGVGFYQTTTKNGQRASTAEQFLRAIEHHPNLTVLNNVSVARLLFSQHTVTGVVYQDASGSEHSVQVSHEVILSAGALATPTILMRSGIGRSEDLLPHGIQMVQHLPGVGMNFQDHLEVPVFARIRQPISLAGQDKGLNALKHGIQWKLFKTGLLTSNVVESGGFVDTTGGNRPDVQFHILPALMGDVDRLPIEGHGMTLNPCFLRPKSRGQIRLSSTDVNAQAIIDAQFLSAPEDLATLLRAVKLARKILRAPALQTYVSEELGPSKDDYIDDETLLEWIRAYCKTVYHPAGTCKMGADEMAVVNPQLKVYGIQGLRIADASIMPTLPSGNTNAPSIMIGERCADFILNHQ